MLYSGPAYPEELLCLGREPCSAVLFMVAPDGACQLLPFRFRDEKSLLHPIQKFQSRGRRISGRSPLQLAVQRTDDFSRDLRAEVGREKKLLDQIGTCRRFFCENRSVVFVHVLVRLLPDKTSGKGRGRPGHGLGDAHHPRPELFDHAPNVREIELVLQARAPGFEHDGEIAVGRNSCEQLLGPEPDEPERHPAFEARFR